MYTIFVIHDSEGKTFFDADFQSIDKAPHGQKFSYPFLKEGYHIKNSIFLFLFAVRFTKYPEMSYTTSTA
jgi:hypothetical protein